MIVRGWSHANVGPWRVWHDPRWQPEILVETFVARGAPAQRLAGPVTLQAGEVYIKGSRLAARSALRH
ncbi:MAG: hypothetical protein R3F33_13290, partial [Planctomycetota bacterium]